MVSINFKNFSFKLPSPYSLPLVSIDNIIDLGG